VLGTTPAFFQHFAYGDKQPLVLQQGQAFADTLDGLYEAVIGAEVARKLGYGLGQSITLGHGMHDHDHEGEEADEHADKPFKVVGILAPTGTPVLAAKAGRVALVQAVAGYGNTVLLDHGDGVETLYAHLQEALVREGDWIDQGAQLGAVGMTGAATGPHLHFELRNRAQALQAIDPTPHLPPLMAPPQIAGGVATLVP
jgi:murein DD-endopeptidase MepM/ murein hydrolase activator NlpD